MIKQYSTTEEIKTASQICLQHRLHEPMGSMRTWYMYSEQYIETLFIYYRYNRPVGAFALLKENGFGAYYNCGTCIKMEYRNRGYGKRLVNFVKEKGIEIKPWTGSQTARQFYNKVLN